MSQTHSHAEAACKSRECRQKGIIRVGLGTPSKGPVYPYERIFPYAFFCEPNPSNQFQPLHAGVAFLADDDVVVHGNAERLRHVDDRLRHLDVGVRRRWVARGVIVDEDDRGRRKLQRPLDHLARIDRRVVHGADLLQFVDDQLVALVEEQHAELLLVGERHRRAAIVEHARPR